MLHLRQFWFSKLLIELYLAHMTLAGTRWYVKTVRDPQLACDQKKFGNHWLKCCNPPNDELLPKARRLTGRINYAEH